VPESIALFLEQVQSPTLGTIFLGIIVASLAIQLAIPNYTYIFTGFFLLINILLKGGIAIVNSDPSENFLPTIEGALLGIAILLISRYSLGESASIKGLDEVAAPSLDLAARKSTLAIEPGITCHTALTPTAEKGYQYQFKGEPIIFNSPLNAAIDARRETSRLLNNEQIQESHFLHHPVTDTAFNLSQIKIIMRPRLPNHPYSNPGNLSRTS
jgi:hypothetical protein